MKLKHFIFISITFLFFLNGQAQTNNIRRVILLEDNWKFIRQEVAHAEKPETIAENWETVTVPHDWAIKGRSIKKLMHNW